MVIIVGPSFVALGILFAIMFVRARDRAPRCRFCRQAVTTGAVRCSHCGQELGTTFTLREERAASPAGTVANADRRTFWWIVGILGGVFGLVGLVLLLNSWAETRAADGDERLPARRSQETALSARPPAAPAFSAEEHQLMLDREEAARTAAAGNAVQPTAESIPSGQAKSVEMRWHDGRDADRRERARTALEVLRQHKARERGTAPPP